MALPRKKTQRYGRIDHKTSKTNPSGANRCPADKIECNYELAENKQYPTGAVHGRTQEHPQH